MSSGATFVLLFSVFNHDLRQRRRTLVPFTKDATRDAFLVNSSFQAAIVDGAKSHSKR